jgi:biotin-dependent carboxylase-like uncharacterized protein
MIRVEAVGSGLSVQDSGRPGWRRFGLPAGGAMDAQALAHCNRLLGNEPSAPALEIIQMGARLRVEHGGWIALAGADACQQASSGTAFRVEEGACLSFDQPCAQRFSYLAVCGGFRVDRWMGSAAVDARSGLGRPCETGDQLIAEHKEAPFTTEGVARRRLSSPETSHLDAVSSLTENVFSVYPGYHYDGFGATEQSRFVTNSWHVSPQSDRSGYRLRGDPIKGPPGGTSEPVLPGCVQIPGNGAPIVTLQDGPTVGGYPVIALLQERDIGRFAQCQTEAQINFQWIDSI